MYQQDTIAAISTAASSAAIGIVRISGKKAFDIAETLFKGKKKFGHINSHTINYGKIIDPSNNQVIDQVLLSKMKKPNTYTREDVVEINCHGGVTVLKKILELILKEGARAAEPGEFTKRAFLNGRIDLSQAEAVIDIINSKTERSTRAAVEQLEGNLSVLLKEIRSRLIDVIAHIEVDTDFPEHDEEEITGMVVQNEISQTIKQLESVIKDFEKGRIIREGIKAVIIGKTNVGKSSLMNRLVGKQRAIVTHIPGTTRDTIEEYVNINGIPLRIVDTAGIRETEDVVEKIGVEAAQKAAQTAELIIMMFDASAGIEKEDISILKTLQNKNLILVINKTDLVNQEEIEEMENKLKGRNVVKLSLKENTGVRDLENSIISLFFKGDIDIDQQVPITNIRHKNLIDRAIRSLEQAQKAYQTKMPLDFLIIDIRDAAEYLGQITGQSVSQDVLEKIFSSFCIGK